MRYAYCVMRVRSLSIPRVSRTAGDAVVDLAQFRWRECACLALGKRAERAWPDGNAHQSPHTEAQCLAEAADVPVPAFVQGDLQPAGLFRLPQQAHLARAQRLAVGGLYLAAQASAQGLVREAVDLRVIDLRQLAGRVQLTVCPEVVVGE